MLRGLEEHKTPFCHFPLPCRPLCSLVGRPQPGPRLLLPPGLSGLTAGGPSWPPSPPGTKPPCGPSFLLDHLPWNFSSCSRLTETLCQDLQTKTSFSPPQPSQGSRAGRHESQPGQGECREGTGPVGSRQTARRVSGPPDRGRTLRDSKQDPASIRRGQGVGACFQASTCLCSPAEASSSRVAHSANCLKQAVEVEPHSQHCLPAPGNTSGRNTHACHAPQKPHMLLHLRMREPLS